MGKKMKLDIKKNFSNATKKEEIKSDALALFAAPLWVIPASLLKLSGWGGLTVSFLATWVTGAILNVQGLRRAAVALTATHLLYAKGTNFMQSTLKINPWDMGGAKIGTTTTTTARRTRT